MRCAAALASAFEEVAQVRYSRSGSLARGGRTRIWTRPASCASAWATLSTASKGAARRCRRSGLRKCRARSAPRYFRHARDGDSASIHSRSKSLRTFATGEIRQFWLIGPADEQRLCWNLNALQKIGDGDRGEITISWMVKPVTAIASSTADCGEVLQFCAVAPRPCPRCPSTCPSRDRDIARGRPLPLAG